MKKFLVLLATGIIATSCGGGGETKAKEEGKEEAKQEAAQTEEKSPEYKAGLELVAKSDCFTCHKVSEKFVGPAYQDVANRYENSPAVIDTLSGKIISGGAGRWGDVPMTPHPQIAKEDAKTMVKYILSLKK